MAPQQDPLMQALERADAPVRFCVRDDDAGWADARLFALLQVMEEASVPIDLAAIPNAVTPALARELKARQRAGQRVGVHQHGLAHINHETSGRKCEFGAAREPWQRESDLRRGREMLRALFEDSLDPLFTPPWNRVSPDTPAMLRALGFSALSRDASAPAQSELPEMRVHSDWTKQWRLASEAKGDPAVRIASDLASHVAAGTCVGLMLHHALMGPEQLQCLRGLLSKWRAHPNARWIPMIALGEKSLAVS
jgi:predicted deacetylase